MSFEFKTAGRIIFGIGTRNQLKKLIKAKRVMVITGKTITRAQPILSILDEMNLHIDLFSVGHEPDVELVEAGVHRAKSLGSETVISVGGGSVLDTGKVIAAMINNRGELLDYLEVIGNGKKLESQGVPHIAIPTTAGTGSEVTSNSVLASPLHRIKVSMRSPFLLPSVALIDPELTYSLPPLETANTGMDAFTQLLEAFVTPFANPITDGFCREGLKLCSQYLVIAYRCGHDAEARKGMSMASLLSGMALANAKLGAVHGFAGPIGGFVGAPHGAICARLLPFVVETNISVLRKASPDHPSLERYKEAARICTQNSTAEPEALVDWCFNLIETLQIKSLNEFGLDQAVIPEIVLRAEKASSMKGNPVILPRDQLVTILQKAINQNP